MPGQVSYESYDHRRRFAQPGQLLARLLRRRARHALSAMNIAPADAFLGVEDRMSQLLEIGGGVKSAWELFVNL